MLAGGSTLPGEAHRHTAGFIGRASPGGPLQLGGERGKGKKRTEKQKGARRKGWSRGEENVLARRVFGERRHLEAGAPQPATADLGGGRVTFALVDVAYGLVKEDEHPKDVKKSAPRLATSAHP